MSDNTVRGRFVWHELMTTDIKSAEGFYTKVVGWTTKVWPQNPSYTMFMTGGRPMAGLMALPEEARAMGAPPHWLTYIGTSDVDQTVRQATELGGRVLKAAMDLPTVGRFAVIQDPQGAVFAAFAPSQGPMGDGKPGLGDFSWHELVTTDWQTAFGFYQKVFGWEKTESMDMGAMGTYQMYGWNSPAKKTLGGMFNKPKEMPAPPHWMPYAVVADSRRAAEIVKSAGGRIVNGPMEVPGGDWIAQGMDLQGAFFAVHSVTPKAAATPATAKAPKAPKTKTLKRATPAKAAKKATAKKTSARKSKKKSKPAKRKAARPKKKARGR